ncbi:MAG: glycosyl hydrolase 115 family protein [Sedimentisphaerales bacterium]|nr:glycosyl hydrolase 115 family protein [Sedimentisphaerales bacterium]
MRQKIVSIVRKNALCRSWYVPDRGHYGLILELVFVLFFSFAVQAGLGLSENLVAEVRQPEAFPLVGADEVPPLCYDPNDYKGVVRAVGDLQADIERVTDKKPRLSPGRPSSGYYVAIGTVGKSEIVDQLIASGTLNLSDLKGKRESFVITTVSKPLPGIDQVLVIAGSDKRGTIYGIYEICEQLGVSPWYWWADVPPKKRSEAYILPGRYASGEPAVHYRGIFINDEEPCFGPWARQQFGGVNSRLYAHMFELILRLRGNYLWPAMWGKAFNEDDPENPRLADEYGIVMGTSHHEPMIRAQAEWTKHRSRFGKGEWNYATNEQGLRKFWEEGIRRNKDYESLVTIGMRGDGDEPMIKGGDMDSNVRLLEKIVADQRKILADIINPDVTQIPQMWALYKEVADYYAHGMKVPDDVTLLWCDDNWGNIRRLPTPQERGRSGRAGIYYHFDYVGSPRSYKWINTNPLPKIWEQMNMAYDYGADRVWVVNVGDLKPMELPIEFFLRMAWNPKAMPKEKIAEFTRKWAKREFGAKYADSIADIVSKYAKYNGWRKPELLEPATFSLINFQEADRVLAGWQAITAEAEKIHTQLSPEFRDAFYQLVLYPTKASATVTEMYIAAGRNRLYAAQGRVSANAQAERVRELFQRDKELTEAYHRLGGGRWNHMMAQTRIGYTSWNDPRNNIMPKVTELNPDPSELMGVAIEGSQSAWPGESNTAVLPAFDSLNRQNRWFEVFKRGSMNFTFSVSADQPWIRFSAASGTVDQDQRIWVSVDWDKMPVGEYPAVITVSRMDGERVQIHLNAVRSDKYTRQNVVAFGGLTGPVAIAAERATKIVDAGDVRWEKIPDYGRGLSGMAIFPVTARSVTPPENSPRMEYPVLIARAGEIHVDLVTGPTLNIQPDRGVRIAVSFDDQPPQIIDAFQEQSYADPSRRGDLSAPAIRDWYTWVKDNARTLKSTHQIPEPGVHTLKVWMVDPGVVLERLIVYSENLPKSYLGPVENPCD